MQLLHCIREDTTPEYSRDCPFIFTWVKTDPEAQNRFHGNLTWFYRMCKSSAFKLTGKTKGKQKDGSEVAHYNINKLSLPLIVGAFSGTGTTSVCISVFVTWKAI